MSDTNYEFNEQQNQVFVGLAGAMKFVGGAMLALSVVFLIAALVSCFREDYWGMSINLFTKSGAISTLASLIQSGTLFFMGIWTIRASGHVSCIATTEGADITHLMVAMEHLADFYSLLRNLVRFALLAAVVVGALILFVSLFGS